MTQNILLAAHALGYGACWVGAFNDALITQVLDIPSDMRPVSIIPVGKVRGEYPEKRDRRSASEIVISEKF